MTKLFSAVNLKEITLKNKIAMSPMSMYSVKSEDGHLKPFHITNYISRAIGQVGLGDDRGDCSTA